MTNDVAHKRYIRRCIELSRQAVPTNDSPVGSLIVRDNHIVAEGIEAVRAMSDVTAHAEIQALRAAFVQLASYDLTGCHSIYERRAVHNVRVRHQVGAPRRI
ncbi:MAG TPA: deaminase [Bryobacteraceae bacterium]|nr:deaminase [Bryobacteraceae bacterium]